MARAFARRGHDDETRYTAHLDADERGVVAELLRQVRLLIAPGGRGIQTETAGDEFDAIVAGLGADFGATPTVPDSPEGLGGRGLPDEPRDPALDRLFPSANRTDAEAAAEFRRLTESSLRSRKVAGLTTAIDVLGRARRDVIELTPEQAQTFLVALTDVRLVLGDRLGLRDDEDATRLEEVALSLDPNDPSAYAIAVYDFLTWLQESLATSMLR
jgi:hypothetical protein